MKAHCLFEQSATFKNEFKKLGIEAYDYDIGNDSGEVDFQLDLFREIEIAYDGGASVFDSMSSDDIILAFFPCIRFCEKAGMHLSMNMVQWIGKPLDFKLEESMRFQNEQTYFYSVFCKMLLVCLRKGLRIIVENPYSVQGYLYQNLPLKPAYIDKSRNLHGDDYRKPTQFFFVNCEPRYNLVGCKPKPITKVIDYMEHGGNNLERSRINPDYAEWFIKAMILDDLENDCEDSGMLF